MDREQANYLIGLLARIAEAAERIATVMEEEEQPCCDCGDDEMPERPGWDALAILHDEAHRMAAPGRVIFRGGD